MNEKTIPGLDLIIIDNLGGVKKNGQFKHNCHFTKEYEHALRRKDNHQINSLIDLIISQGNSLDLKIKELQNKMDNLLEEIRKLAINIDYIFDQNSVILTKNSNLTLEPITQSIKDLKQKLNIHD